MSCMETEPQNLLDALDEIQKLFDRMSGVYAGHSGDDAHTREEVSQLLSNELHEDTDEDEIEKVRTVFKQHFRSGIRPGSIIDINRFRRYYREDTGSDVREDFPFEEFLPKIGILHGGKVFPQASSESATWKTLINELLKNGHSLLAYSRVMELHSPELMASGIISAEMLHDFIADDASGSFEIGNKYFAAVGNTLDPADVIASDIRENTVFLSEGELSRQHPYICTEDIHHVLASDLRYVWNCRDVYVIENRLTFDESETADILSEIHRLILADGYCSLAQFDFAESKYLNDPEITVNVVSRVFYSRYLANEYDKHGKIVSRHGEDIDAKIPLREYCRNRADVMLEQVFAAMADFNITDYLVLTTMHEEMVRVDLERFTAPSQVAFDVASIDHVLDSCFTGGVMAFGAFLDFSQFPAVPSWSWNPYLLEAFLRRESREFRLLTSSAVSKKVAGVVVRKNDAIDDIIDACAVVAVDAGLSADDEVAVGDYLQKNGCILQRCGSKLAAITARMNLIYERMK